MTSILNRQVEVADDGGGLHDDAEVGSVIDVGAKGGESVNYLQRLNGAKLAAEAWNINRLRAKASEVLTGEFLRPSLYGVAQHADKVRLQA